MPGSNGEVTALLRAWRGGDEQALERLTPLVYEHLRKLGRQYVRRERIGVRGDATSLVHEAFIRLVDARAVDWQDRKHFLASGYFVTAIFRNDVGGDQRVGLPAWP